jgi:DNA-binding transcriptional MerR regulator
MGHDDHLLTLSQLAGLSGLTLSRVRYYERAGLLPAPTAGGRGRRYRADALRRLQVIGSAQDAGLSLAEIGELVELRGLVDDDLARARP